MKIGVKWLVVSMACLVCGCVESSVIDDKVIVTGITTDEGDHPKACESEGLVRCGDECIDPLRSQAYCGADEKCENFTACDTDFQECKNGRCEARTAPPTDMDPDEPPKDVDPDEPPLNCQNGEHEYNKTCELDSVDNCGSHDMSCGRMVNGWADGKCVSGQCVVERCQSGMHLNGNGCEADSSAHCGSVSNNCADTVEGWLEGDCVGGACIVTVCKTGYHITVGKICEKDPPACDIAGQVRCGSECINPLTNSVYCGADGKCENYTKCGGNQSCKSGKCINNEIEVSASDPSFATDDGISNGITLRLINKSGKDICFSGKLKMYIKQGGSQGGWGSDGLAVGRELECHISAPSSNAGGWPHWYENRLKLSAGEFRDYNFTAFTEYQGNGVSVQTIQIPVDTYANGSWFFVSEDNPSFIGSGGAGGVPAIKLGHAALKDDGSRGDNAFLIHVRPVKASDCKISKGKKYNLVIYEADIGNKYWHCD